MQNWKWDLGHLLIALAFVTGCTSAVAAFLKVMPPGMSVGTTIMFALPFAILAGNNVVAFFKSTPKDLGSALAAGEALLGGASAAAKAATKTLMAIAFVFVCLAGGVACGEFFGIAHDAADCSSKVFDDAKAGKSLPQILIDVPGECGMDFADIIALLTSPQAPPSIQSTRAYKEAMTEKAKILAAAADGGK